MSTSEVGAKAVVLRYNCTVGLSTMEGRGFYYPVDTAIGKDGLLYVLSRSLENDPRGIRITVCGLEGEFDGTFGSHGEGDGQFIWPTAIAIDSLGHFYVSDEYTNRITVFDSSRKFLMKWGTPGDNDGKLNAPSGIALDSDDNLYVTDHRNYRIQKFTSDGKFLFSFGSEGAGPGQFNFPWGITVNTKGEVFVADWHNDRIQRFSSDGTFLSAYGESGRGDGQFHRPSGVAVDQEGHLYVADWGNERVQVLDQEGDFVMKLRGEATHSKWAEDFLRTNVEEAEARSKSNLEPEIDFFVDDPHEESSHIEKLFWGPISVKLDQAGRLYVTESNRHRVQVYERES